MKKDRTTTDEVRLRVVERLYRTGMKLREVGERLTPPVSPQRVVQLLDRGVNLGLFDDPRKARRAGLHVTEEQVRSTARTTRNREKVAKRLRLRRDILEARFGALLDAVVRQRQQEAKEARAAVMRQRAIDEYCDMAERLGRNPTTADLGNGTLRRRIYAHFGTFEAFLEAAGVRPDYVKRLWQTREALRAALNLQINGTTKTQDEEYKD